jgi:hypothetical protein
MPGGDQVAGGGQPGQARADDQDVSRFGHVSYLRICRNMLARVSVVKAA